MPSFCLFRLRLLPSSLEGLLQTPGGAQADRMMLHSCFDASFGSDSGSEERFFRWKTTLPSLLLNKRRKKIHEEKAGKRRVVSASSASRC